MIYRGMQGQMGFRVRKLQGSVLGIPIVRTVAY